MDLQQHIVGNALFIKDHLIISDMQLGYEDQLRKTGVQIPLQQDADIIRNLRDSIRSTHPKRVVFNGDIKHEFGIISKAEWKAVDAVFDLVQDVAELILVEGNHDTVLRSMLGKRDVELRDHYRFDGVYCCHGHQLPKDSQFKAADTIIIGHEHPAVGLREQGRYERFKCFLHGDFDGKELIVMPSFNPLFEGTDILQEKLMSPFLRNIKDFEVLITGEKPMYFGKVKDLDKP